MPWTATLAPGAKAASDAIDNQITSDGTVDTSVRADQVAVVKAVVKQLAAVVGVPGDDVSVSIVGQGNVGHGAVDGAPPEFLVIRVFAVPKQSIKGR